MTASAGWIFLIVCLPFVKSFSSTLCFINRYETSNICKGRSDDLSCNEREVIMINKVRYTLNVYQHKSCYDCDKNAEVIHWDIGNISFKNRLYHLCSKQNNCSFDAEIESPSNEEKINYQVWRAVVSYDCISSDLIKDICMPLEAELEDTADTVYLSLPVYHRYTNTKLCTCMVTGYAKHTSITVIDNRPYYKNDKCRNSSVFINGNPLYQCFNETEPSLSLYNISVNVTESKTNITVAMSPMMQEILWMSITGLGVSVQCGNIEAESTTSLSTKSSTQFEATSEKSIQTTTKVKDSVTVDNTSDSLLLQTPNSSVNFPTLAVVGSSVGLLALVLAFITAFLCYRWKINRKSETRGTEAVYYNETQVEAEPRDGSGTNVSHNNRERDELYVNGVNVLPKDQEADNNVYLSMEAQTDNYVKRTEKESESPYYKNLTNMTANMDSSYCTLDKLKEDKQEYNYLHLI